MNRFDGKQKLTLLMKDWKEILKSCKSKNEQNDHGEDANK